MARRKKQFLADFARCGNCYDHERSPGIWDSVFHNANDIVVELGAGKAELSLELARRHKDKNFIAIDRKADRLARPAKTALQEGIHNIAFLRTDIRRLPEYFSTGSISEIWLTFPDPYPKDRHAKHRMVNNRFLALYRSLLQPGGQVHLKTDNHKLFNEAVETAQQSNARITYQTDDLHSSDAPEDARVRTFYESRFVSEGKKIKYAAFRL